jgi:hypothetical protein
VQDHATSSTNPLATHGRTIQVGSNAAFPTRPHDRSSPESRQSLYPDDHRPGPRRHVCFCIAGSMGERATTPRKPATFHDRNGPKPTIRDQTRCAKFGSRARDKLGPRKQTLCRAVSLAIAANPLACALARTGDELSARRKIVRRYAARAEGRYYGKTNCLIPNFQFRDQLSGDQ